MTIASNIGLSDFWISVEAGVCVWVCVSSGISCGIRFLPSLVIYIRASCPCIEKITS